MLLQHTTSIKENKKRYTESRFGGSPEVHLKSFLIDFITAGADEITR
jgi:hypothetical protein